MPTRRISLIGKGDKAPGRAHFTRARTDPRSVPHLGPSGATELSGPVRPPRTRPPTHGARAIQRRVNRPYRPNGGRPGKRDRPPLCSQMATHLRNHTLLRGGVDIHVVHRLLRHANIATTIRYLHLCDADLTDAVDHAFPGPNRDLTGRGRLNLSPDAFVPRPRWPGHEPLLKERSVMP